VADLACGGSGIFLPRNLDDPNHVEPADEIRFCAQRVLRRCGTCAERSTLADLPVRAERGAAPCATAAHAIVTILLDVSALYLRIASVLIPIPFGVGAPDTGTDENPWSARRPGGDSRRIDLHGAEGRAGTLTQLGGSNGRHCQRVRPGRAVAMFASCAFREPACGEPCGSIWGL
jgi:hypothetical protein